MTLILDHLRRTIRRKLKLFLALGFLLCLVASIYTYRNIDDFFNHIGIDPNKLILLILFNSFLVLALLVMLVRRATKLKLLDRYYLSKSNLTKRIISIFCLIAIIPTIAVSIFSTVFFNLGLQSWFDQRVNTALEQSIKVAKYYISERRTEMQSTAISVAEDLGDLFYKLMNNPKLFEDVLNAQAEMRSFDEAIVFQRATNHVLAQTKFSFSLSFSSISAEAFAKADMGEVVEVKSDKQKIRMLIKLKEYDDSYLLIGRFIDLDILKYINETEGAAAEYFTLKKKIGKLQVEFTIIFILLALILLITAVIIGMSLAHKIVKPILKLVGATAKIQQGDFSVQVHEGNNNDEISNLSKAFNLMVRQIDNHRRDLVIAQRSAAWADVAQRVAHEVKNPLTPIQLSAERIKRKVEAGQVLEEKESIIKYSTTILRHVDDIRNIVTEFSNFAKLPSPILAQSDIIPFLQEIVEARDLIKDKIDISYINDIKSLEMPFDRNQISRVMTNLIKNAEESLENSDQVKPQIIVKTQLEDKLFIINVIDNGKGFPEELIDKLAKPYVTTRRKGTGLGLSIVAKIIQEHYGRMEFSNNTNGGASVKLIFDITELIKNYKK